MKKLIVALALSVLVAAPSIGVANENQAAQVAFGQCMGKLIEKTNMTYNAKLNDRPLIEHAFIRSQPEVMKCLRKYFAVYEVTASF